MNQEKEVEGATRAPLMELRHEPEPGYRTIFYVVFGAALLYLVVIMMMGGA